MKTICRLFSFTMASFLFNCDIDGIPENFHNPTPSLYNWQMVVKNVGSTTESSGNYFYTNFLSGQPMRFFENVTNTTPFRFIPNKRTIELKPNIHNITIWQLYGEMKWVFRYERNLKELWMKGYSTEPITDYARTSVLATKCEFEFLGILISTNNYEGKYTWKETAGENLCLKIEGDMYISQRA